MRARMALVGSGTSCHIREVKLSRKPAELIAASPKATVPVLVHSGDKVIAESLDIMRWALQRNDPEGWLEREDPGLIGMNDGPFKHHLDRYKYPERHGSDATRHRAAGLELLGELEQRLTASAHLCGEQLGFTDIAIFPFVRQFAATDHPWFAAQSLEHLKAWLNRQLASPLFHSIMVRLEPWNPDDPPRDFPV